MKRYSECAVVKDLSKTIYGCFVKEGILAPWKYIGYEDFVNLVKLDLVQQLKWVEDKVTCKHTTEELKQLHDNHVKDNIIYETERFYWDMCPNFLKKHFDLATKGLCLAGSCGTIQYPQGIKSIVLYVYGTNENLEKFENLLDNNNLGSCMANCGSVIKLIIPIVLLSKFLGMCSNVLWDTRTFEWYLTRQVELKKIKVLERENCYSILGMFAYATRFSMQGLE